MRYLDLSIQQSPGSRHPMHQFVIDHDDYTVTRQLYRHQYAEKEHALLFHVKGPVDQYKSALEEISSIIDFEITSCSDDSFYLYIREWVSEAGQELIDAVSQPGLILAQPVEYRSDKTIRIIVIGPTDAIQKAADSVSDANKIEILEIGDFNSSRIDTHVGLTQRQLEAVSVAVDSGYYEVPRQSSLEEIASCLECSTGTAGELLRRAERKAMSKLVTGGHFN